MTMDKHFAELGQHDLALARQIAEDAGLDFDSIRNGMHHR